MFTIQSANPGVESFRVIQTSDILVLVGNDWNMIFNQQQGVESLTANQHLRGDCSKTHATRLGMTTC